MSYPHTIQAGLESLREIEQLLKEFSHEGYVPSIDLDLILQKTRNLYEVLLLLRQYQSEPVAGTESHRQMAGPAKTAAIDDEIIQSYKIPPEPSAPAEHPQKPSSPASPAHGDENREKKFLSERFAGRTSVYDSIHEAAVQKSGGALGQGRPVMTILSAIGINDRYTFIRELFNNDAASFERTIHRLDEAADFNAAYNYLIQQFDWDMDSEPVQVLLDVIRRKHIKTRNE